MTPAYGTYEYYEAIRKASLAEDQRREAEHRKGQEIERKYWPSLGSEIERQLADPDRLGKTLDHFRWERHQINCGCNNPQCTNDK